MPGLAASPRVCRAAHHSWQLPGLQNPWALKGQPPAWAWRHLVEGGREREARGRKEVGGVRKVC